MYAIAQKSRVTDFVYITYYLTFTLYFSCGYSYIKNRNVHEFITQVYSAS